MRISDLPDSSLVAKRIAPCRHAIVAAPAYLEQYGTPRAPEELRDQAFNFPPFPALRAAAEREFQRDRERYQTKSKGCDKGCECSASDDPADTKTSTFRRSFSFQEDAAGFGGGVNTWTLESSKD